jgi:2-methylcitrate dehydratase
MGRVHNQRSASTMAEELAAFVVSSSYDDVPRRVRDQLKIRILDSLACAFGALGGEPIRLVREQLDDFGGNALCSLIGGGSTAPDRAAMFNGALVRYLDFNDSYLAKGETCHPSDNLAPVLAAAEYRDANGRELLVALAMAYQVQCRLSDVVPVRDKGFDHTTQGAYAIACGVSRALGLGRKQTTNAIAMCGTAFNSLRVTRTGSLSHWKGLAYPNTAFGCSHCVFLAMRGITGPAQVFEGNKGFMDTISGPFHIDWSHEVLDRPAKTILKKYNAEIHSQSAIEAVLELRQEHSLVGSDVAQVDLEIFDVAYNIIGGGQEGDKSVVRTKEEADHSLPYLLAVAILDGQVMPEQYRPERIRRQDVQRLMKRIQVHASESLSRRFPDEMPCRLQVTLKDGRILMKAKADYEGFLSRPMSWESTLAKFDRLAEGHTTAAQRQELAAAITQMENLRVRDFTSMLARGKTKKASNRTQPRRAA